MRMKKILYPPTVNWNLLFQRPNHILKVLAKNGYLSYFMNHMPHIKGQYVAKELTEIEKNMFIVPLFYPPQNINPDILYYSYPDHNPFLHQMNPTYNIFDVIDAPTAEFKNWEKNWEKCIDEATLVMASAEVLYEDAKEINDNIILVKNGVDYDHYQGRKRNPYKKLKVKGFNKKNPIIGFIGAIATWVDMQLMYKSAFENPDYNFVIVGLEYNLKLGKTPDNLFFLGHKPYEELPSWVNHMDVCTLPFIPNTEVANACSPLKFYEYLASGNPVVTTALPEVKEKYVYWSKDKEEYIENIRKAVDEKLSGNKDANKRRAIAKSCSWDERCKPLLEELDKW